MRASEIRYEELLSHFGGRSETEDPRDAQVRLVHPSHCCSQKMRISRWDLLEKFGDLRHSKAPEKHLLVTTAQASNQFVASNGMRFRLLRSAK